MPKQTACSQFTKSRPTTLAFLCALSSDFAPLRELYFSQRRKEKAKGAKEELIRALILLVLISLPPAVAAQQLPSTRTLSGTILTQQNERVAGVSILVRSAAGEQRAESDAQGNFRLTVPAETLSLRFFGQKLALVAKTLDADEPSENLEIRVAYVVPTLQESVVIEATDARPEARPPQRNRLQQHALFARRSTLPDLERRNQRRAARRRREVSGDSSLRLQSRSRRRGRRSENFSQQRAAESGDAGTRAGLSRQLEESDAGTCRGRGHFERPVQRAIRRLLRPRRRPHPPERVAARRSSPCGCRAARSTRSAPSSPTAPRSRAPQRFLAYEGSRTDGPFQNPLRYGRDNLTGNYTRRPRRHAARRQTQLRAQRLLFFRPDSAGRSGRGSARPFRLPRPGQRRARARWSLGVYYRDGDRRRARVSRSTPPSPARSSTSIPTSPSSHGRK